MDVTNIRFFYEDNFSIKFSYGIEKPALSAGNFFLFFLVVNSDHDVIPFDKGQLKGRVVEGIVVVGQFPVAPFPYEVPKSIFILLQPFIRRVSPKPDGGKIALLHDSDTQKITFKQKDIVLVELGWNNKGHGGPVLLLLIDDRNRHGDFLLPFISLGDIGEQT